MYKDKYTIGNVCLVVFLAFIFSVFVATWKAGPAAAAQPISVSPTTGSGTFDSTSRSISISVKLQPLTPTSFGSLTYYVTLVNTPTPLPANAVFTTNASVYATPYATLVNLVYTAPVGFTLAPTFQVVYQSIYTDMVSKKVYLTLQYVPPETPPPGGGVGVVSPAPPAAPPGTVATPAGDMTVTQTSAQLTVSTQQVAQQMSALPAGQTFVMPVAPHLIRPAMEYIISPDLQQAAAGRQVTFPADNANVTVPLDQIPPPSTVSAQGAVLQVSIVKQSASEAGVSFGEVFGAAATGEFLPVALPYKIELTWVTPTGQKEKVSLEGIDRLLKVTIKFDKSLVTDPSRLAGIQKDDDGNVTTVPSTVVRFEDGEADLYLRHLSYYSVAKWTKDFADIASHWASGDIVQMAARSVVKGFPDGKFVPDGNVTRGQFAALLVRALGRKMVRPEVARFKDVAAWTWYYEAIETCAGLGLVTGYSDGTFKPEAKITRQEMATMVVRALALAKTSPEMTAAEAEQLLSTFVDTPSIGAWAKESVAKAMKAGIVQGRTETTFQPLGDATRAEAVVMLKRLLKHNGHI